MKDESGAHLQQVTLGDLQRRLKVSVHEDDVAQEAVRRSLSDGQVPFIVFCACCCRKTGQTDPDGLHTSRASARICAISGRAGNKLRVVGSC